MIEQGDLNGDGIPDLVVANRGSNSVSVLLGNGNGTFQAQTTYATGSEPYSLTLADVTGDGKLDLLVANQSSNRSACCWATATAPSRRNTRLP